MRGWWVDRVKEMRFLEGGVSEAPGRAVVWKKTAMMISFIKALAAKLERNELVVN